MSNETIGTAVPQVYEAIAAVTADLCKEGIAKDRKNEQQRYNFRGVDDVYNALAPLLARHRLVILPRIMEVLREERQSAGNKPLYFTFVQVEFDFCSAKDGSKHTARTVGEAMDSADKSSNKAMSAAFKYACFQVFCIPTEGDNDADAHHHEAAPRSRSNAPAIPPGMTTGDQVENPVAKARNILATASTFEAAMKATTGILTRIAQANDSDAPSPWKKPGDILAFAAMRLCDLADSQEELFASSDLIDATLDKDTVSRLSERRTKKADHFAVA